MEVLAPAGSKEAFKAALAGGADAVYLGGKMFGARRFAQNFSDQEMEGAVKLAHSRGVKVYVTVNVLIKERELPLAFDYLDLLDRIGVDAVIVQDRGLARLILDSYGIPVHASTQMGIHSPEDALWAEGMGMERVILARELSLEDVERVRRATNVGIEVFIHGALCYCFSGQCLFSSVLGGRSGNRGMCAQPCRKRYTLGRDTAYMLSTADLFSVDALPRLIEMGVDAIKIEGRLRSPVYVYLASKVYKAAVERAVRGEEELVTPREREMLSVAFNRGSGPGYLLTDNVMLVCGYQDLNLLLGEAAEEWHRGDAHLPQCPGLVPGPHRRDLHLPVQLDLGDSALDRGSVRSEQAEELPSADMGVGSNVKAAVLLGDAVQLRTIAGAAPYHGDGRAALPDQPL